MSSGWVPSKDDSPSVLSNRVFTIRRLNRVESQRLGTRLDSLNAEEEHFRSFISQEQQMLRKQLTEIRHVKENPAVGIERRKLLQQISYKEARRLGSAGHGTLRYRSLSTGDNDSRTSSSQLQQVNIRSRSQSNIASFGSGKEELSTNFRKKSWGSNDSSCNSRSPSEEWSGNSTSASRSAALRQRSLSTGMRPRISAWDGNGKDGGIACLRRDDFGGSNKIEHKRSGPNHGCSTGYLSLELSQNANWAWKARKRLTWDKKSASNPESEVKINSWQTKGEDKNCSQLASTRKERRLRSYSTNSAPTVLEEKVVEVCQGAQQHKRSAQDLQYNRASNSAHGRYSTNVRPKVIDGKVVGVPMASAEKKNSSEHGNNRVSPFHLTRRQRSLTVNCPPIDDRSRDMHNLPSNTDEIN